VPAPRWGYGFDDPLAGVSDAGVEELMQWAGESNPSLNDLEKQIFAKANQGNPLS